MEISKRLKMVANAVTEGNRLADVGTDHGYVPIYLVRKGTCPWALAMDINKGPLQRADMHIREEELTDQIETRLSDGMMRLNRGEVESVVIAGMGGDLMSRILKARQDILEDGVELVLQPQSEWYKVRRMLHQCGYAIRQEWFLKDEGKYYVIMRAMPGQESYEEKYQYVYGALLEEECSPALEEYLNKEINKRKEIIGMIEEASKKNLSDQSQRVKELNEEIILLDQRLRAGR